VVRDGWLPLGDDGTCAGRDVLDLEEMGMPATWQAREARRHRLTPALTVEDFDRPNWRQVARAERCNRSSAYRRIKLGVYDLFFED
jgi:hypothetical protein